MRLDDETAALSLHLSRESTTPLYQQLTEQLKHLIVTHRIKAGRRLPSSRKLATLVRVSRTCVINAYEQSIAEGFLVSRPSAGVFVTKLAEIEEPEGKPNRHSKVPAVKQPVLHGEFVFDTGSDSQLFPFKEWARSAGRVWRHVDAELLSSFASGGSAA